MVWVACFPQTQPKLPSATDFRPEPFIFGPERSETAVQAKPSLNPVLTPSSRRPVTGPARAPELLAVHRKSRLRNHACAARKSPAFFQARGGLNLLASAPHKPQGSPNARGAEIAKWGRCRLPGFAWGGGHHAEPGTLVNSRSGIDTVTLLAVGGLGGPRCNLKRRSQLGVRARYLHHQPAAAGRPAVHVPTRPLGHRPGRP